MWSSAAKIADVTWLAKMVKDLMSQGSNVSQKENEKNSFQIEQMLNADIFWQQIKIDSNVMLIESKNIYLTL